MMAFKSKKVPEKVEKYLKPAHAWCPKCINKRYSLGGLCIICGSKVKGVGE